MNQVKRLVGESEDPTPVSMSMANLLSVKFMLYIHKKNPSPPKLHAPRRAYVHAHTASMNDHASIRTRIIKRKRTFMCTNTKHLHNDTHSYDIIHTSHTTHSHTHTHILNVTVNRISGMVTHDIPSIRRHLRPIHLVFNSKQCMLIDAWLHGRSSDPLPRNVEVSCHPQCATPQE